MYSERFTALNTFPEFIDMVMTGKKSRGCLEGNSLPHRDGIHFL